MEIEVASINAPDRPRHLLPLTEAAEAAQTYCVKSTPRVSAIFQLIGVAITQPDVIFRGFIAALRLGGWDIKSRAFALLYLAEALLIGRWMQQRSLRHLHVHFGGPVATVGMLTAQAWNLPWSLTLHGPDEFFDQDAFYLRQKIESAQFVICISDFCRSQVLRIAPGIPDHRLEIIRLGVDCAALQPAAIGSTQEFAGPLKLVCTGRMVAAKGHRILLAALSALASEGISFECALIGDGPERSSLEALCASLGISQQVRFLGALAHQPTLAQVASADVFVLASFAEGLPVALMEAMALGVPCVSTTIAAIPELIQDRVNGLLVPPGNSSALHAALYKLAGSPALRTELGLKARATTQETYNLSSNLDQLAAMWKRRLPKVR